MRQDAPRCLRLALPIVIACLLVPLSGCAGTYPTAKRPWVGYTAATPTLVSEPEKLRLRP